MAGERGCAFAAPDHDALVGARLRITTWSASSRLLWALRCRGFVESGHIARTPLRCF
jgi:hypothetical protein